MVDHFPYAVERTLELEGVFSDHAADHGGMTKYGITLALYRSLGYTGPIEDLTIPTAKTIYRQVFWDALKLHLIEDRELAAEIFDTAVNMGPGAAVYIVQAALRYLGEPIAVDGLYGPATFAALKKWEKKDARALFKCLNGFQFIGYVDLTDDELVDLIQLRFKSDVAQKVFAYGWTQRIQEYRRA